MVLDNYINPDTYIGLNSNTLPTSFFPGQNAYFEGKYKEEEEEEKKQ